MLYGIDGYDRYFAVGRQILLDKEVVNALILSPSYGGKQQQKVN
jgi:hypothetical protein